MTSRLDARISFPLLSFLEMREIAQKIRGSYAESAAVPSVVVAYQRDGLNGCEIETAGRAEGARFGSLFVAYGRDQAGLDQAPLIEASIPPLGFI